MKVWLLLICIGIKTRHCAQITMCEMVHCGHVSLGYWVVYRQADKSIPRWGCFKYSCSNCDWFMWGYQSSGCPQRFFRGQNASINIWWLIHSWQQSHEQSSRVVGRVTWCSLFHGRLIHLAVIHSSRADVLSSRTDEFYSHLITFAKNYCLRVEQDEHANTKENVNAEA